MKKTIEFDIAEEPGTEAKIKVIGVGGGGCNAVDNMIESGICGNIDYIAANTDAKALKRNKAPTLIQLGQRSTKGLGAGSNPEVGRQAAHEDRDKIKTVLEGANMVFIAAGFGGGTGTGASPIIAEIAKELGILTVAVVTKPFKYEGKRMKVAEIGIDDLQSKVDSIIVIPNEKIMEVLGEDITVPEAFRQVDKVLHGAVAGISEVITTPGLISVDFADVKNVMSKVGRAMMGSGRATGKDRAKDATESAIKSPLLEGLTLKGAQGVLVNITTVPNGLKMREYNEIMSIIEKRAESSEDISIKFGTAEDPDIEGDEIRVTIIATGLPKTPPKEEEDNKEEKIENNIETSSDQSLAGYGMRQRRKVVSQAQTPNFNDPNVAIEYEVPAFVRNQKN